MLERQRPLVGGRNENVTVALCASRTVRNRFPALSRSDVVRDRSNVVKPPPIHVREADGVNAFSIVLFSATLPAGPPPPAPPPKGGRYVIYSARRYPTRAVTLDNGRPKAPGGGNRQAVEPFGPSPNRGRNGNPCSRPNV